MLCRLIGLLITIPGTCYTGGTRTPAGASRPLDLENGLLGLEIEMSRKTLVPYFVVCLIWAIVFVTLAVAILTADLNTAPAVPCAIDGKDCTVRRECTLCTVCTDEVDKCCCRHRPECNCTDPTSGEACCP